MSIQRTDSLQILFTFTKKNKHVLIYHEKGSWLNSQKDQINFTNIFRWTFNPIHRKISLEHVAE